jgi:hypothetical protein
MVLLRTVIVSFADSGSASYRSFNGACRSRKVCVSRIVNSRTNRKQEFPINNCIIDERVASCKRLLAPRESNVADNRTTRHRDVSDAGGSRPVPAPGDELIEGVGLTFGLDSDAAIRFIAGKPGDAEPLGLPPCSLAVIDPLHNTLDPNGEMSSIAHSRNLLHWRVHPTGRSIRSRAGVGCRSLTPRLALKYAFWTE